MHDVQAYELHRLLRLSNAAVSPVTPSAQITGRNSDGCSSDQSIATLAGQSAESASATVRRSTADSLVAAAGEGQLAELQKMHANDPRSIMLCDQGGTTCLLAAVRARQAAVVHWIVAGEDVSAEHKRW